MDLRSRESSDKHEKQTNKHICEKWGQMKTEVKMQRRSLERWKMSSGRLTDTFESPCPLFFLSSHLFSRRCPFSALNYYVAQPGKKNFFVLFSGSPYCSIRSSGVKRVFYFRLKDSAIRSFSISMTPSPTKLPCWTKSHRTPFLINNNTQKRSRPLFSFCISSCPLLPNSNVVAGLSYKREKRQLEEL